MRIAELGLRLLLNFCLIVIVTRTNASTTANYNTRNHYRSGSKEDYVKWRERFLPYPNGGGGGGIVRHHHSSRMIQSPTTTSTSAPITSENDIYYEHLKLRHQQQQQRPRFPDLDRVMQKIDNLQTSSSSTSSSSSSHRRGPENRNVLVRRQWQNPYIRTTTTTPRTTTTAISTTTENDVFEDYGDLVDEDGDENEYSDWDEDPDEEEDVEYEDEDENEEDEDNDPSPGVKNDRDWQAEEATEPPARPAVQHQQSSVSAFTQFKWDNYGTRRRVEESRRQQLHMRPNNEQKAVHAAVQHYMRVHQESQCRKPMPRVIPVQQEHPDPSKTYTPHCTILHRCAEDTGCCHKFETKCGPKKLVPVHLYFYAKALGSTETKVERLMFYNHTECACLENTKGHSSTSTTRPSSTENLLDDRGDSTQGLSFRSATYPIPLYSENLRRCKCPDEFVPKYRYDVGCTCDCEEENQDCLRMKRGKEFLSMKDRRCILDNQCGTPVCEYGTFLRHIGRCQLKQEKLDSYRKVKTND